MSRVEQVVRRVQQTGWPARLLIWLLIPTEALSYTLSSQGAFRDQAIPVVLQTAAFLGWEYFAERLGRWGAAVGLVLTLFGLALGHYFGVVLGVPVLLLSLRGLQGSVLAVVSLIALAVHAPSGSATGLVLTTVPLSLLVYVFHRIAVTARRLALTLDELAMTEVDAERAHLADDLNALIGESLNEVIVQVHATREGLGSRRPEVRAELTAIQSLMERGVQQLRDLSFEPVVGTFESEVQNASTLCRRLGVDFACSVDEVPSSIDQPFALLLREAVTNMFKHAEPTRCTVVARGDEPSGDEYIFSFTNDGVTHKRDRGQGTGLTRDRELVHHMGGVLEAGPLDGGRFRLLVRMPTRPSHTADATVGNPVQARSEQEQPWVSPKG